MISGNMVGAYSQLGKTFTIVDDQGTELIGVVVDQETLFTAHDNDVRSGMIYASDEGVSTGTKDIPSYITNEGFKVITAGSKFVVYLADEQHEYTKLQAIFCPFNTTVADSVAADKVAINNSVYPVQSAIPEASVNIIAEPDGIDFGITNTSDKPWIIRYFTYKEVY